MLHVGRQAMHDEDAAWLHRAPGEQQRRQKRLVRRQHRCLKDDGSVGGRACCLEVGGRVTRSREPLGLVRRSLRLWPPGGAQSNFCRGASKPTPLGDRVRTSPSTGPRPTLIFQITQPLLGARPGVKLQAFCGPRSMVCLCGQQWTISTPQCRALETRVYC